MQDNAPGQRSGDEDTEPSVVYERREREVTIGEGMAVVRDEHEQVIAPSPSAEPKSQPPSAPAEEGYGEASISEGDSGELGDRILGPPDE